MKKNTIKKICLILCFALMVFLNINAGSYLSYSFMFDRADSIDYEITPGFINYEEHKDLLVKRYEVCFTSGEQDVTFSAVCGYLYLVNEYSPTIVISGGYNDVADSLLSYHKYFTSLGYNVFAYDYTGTGNSSSVQNGFIQPLIDLRYALYFINSDGRLKNKNVALFGYSAGAFASSAILNINNIKVNIRAVVSINGFDDAYNLFVNKAKSKIGFLSYLGAPSIYIHQNKLFEDYCKYTAVDGINNKQNVPVLIVQSKKDKSIPYDSLSIYAKKNNITNKNVSYKLFDTHDHTSILYDESALVYQKEVNKILKKTIGRENKKEYLSTIDDENYSKINVELMNDVMDFYKKYI